jgi:hypothetical protein
MDRRLFVESAGIVLANLLLPAFAKSAELDRPIGHRQSFTPAEPWLDSAGKPIHVHGGSIQTAGSLRVNFSRSRHVWLPIRFDNDRPSIDWRAEWALEEFPS